MTGVGGAVFSIGACLPRLVVRLCLNSRGCRSSDYPRMHAFWAMQKAVRGVFAVSLRETLAGENCCLRWVAVHKCADVASFAGWGVGSGLVLGFSPAASETEISIHSSTES